ncbi:MAG: glutaredoxin family protein [Gammaproteobacteria bacterium]|jgi:glutaredoxin|nr:glutaredoxin family protein [Gammaproteobacteria bacterium]
MSNVRKIVISLSVMVLFSLSHQVYASAEKAVVVYGTSWCSYCKKTRQYFEEHHIEYTDYDIETSDIAKQKFQALKGKYVPLIIIGTERIEGFHVETIQQALLNQGLMAS